MVNSHFIGNSCFHAGPDLGGGAIRALAQWHGQPVFLNYDTFRGGSCSNGGALSSIGVSWTILNCVMTGNQAIGWGANPPARGTPGGGSGGAIYTDGNRYTVFIADSDITGNRPVKGAAGSSSSATITQARC